MGNFLKQLAKLVGIPLVWILRDTVVRLLKIEAAKRYIRFIQFVRRMFLVYVGLLICSLFLLLGAALFHVGILGLIYLKLGKEIALGLCVLVGIAYSGGALAWLAWMCSDTTWMRCGQCDELLNPLLRKD